MVIRAKARYLTINPTDVGETLVNQYYVIDVYAVLTIVAQGGSRPFFAEASSITH